jgi:hypothetical protein
MRELKVDIKQRISCEESGWEGVLNSDKQYKQMWEHLNGPEEEIHFRYAIGGEAEKS